MDVEQASATASRPSISRGQSSQHIVGGRGQLRGNRNASHSKNLNKLGKFTAGHAGAKVTMARNSSKTNLRKNQSETSLQYRQRTRSSTSPSKSERSSSVTRRASESAEVAVPSSAQRRPSASGSYIPEFNPITSFDPAHSTAIPAPRSKGKKRSSKDFTKSKKKSGEQPFDFDGEEEFNDEAWEDERPQTNAQEQAELKRAIEISLEEATETERSSGESMPPGEIYQAEPKSPDLPITDEAQLEKTGSQIEGSAPNLSNSHLDRAVQDTTEQECNSNEAENNFRATVREGKRPMKRSPHVSFHIGHDAQSIEAEEDDSETDGSTSEAEEVTPGADKHPFETRGVRSETNQHTKTTRVTERQPSTGEYDHSDADSDADSSPDTVVLAPPTRKPPPSALKPTKALATEPALSTDTSPSLQMKPVKKVQIEEPLDDMETLSRSTSGEVMIGLTMPPTKSTMSKLQQKENSTPQYEFLSKAQRDRASLMQEAHPYPPSAWRDQFLVRAIPFVNDVSDEYTQKFIRRLDRRMETRMNHLLETQDPLLDALRRAQARGLLSAPEQVPTVIEPPRTSGIQGWFSRLGSGTKEDEHKSQTKEEADVARIERWTGMLLRHEWRLAKESDTKTDRSQLVQET